MMEIEAQKPIRQHIWKGCEINKKGPDVTAKIIAEEING
jgi:hypothetical protein